MTGKWTDCCSHCSFLYLWGQSKQNFSVLMLSNFFICDFMVWGYYNHFIQTSYSDFHLIISFAWNIACILGSHYYIGKKSQRSLIILSLSLCNTPLNRKMQFQLQEQGNKTSLKVQAKSQNIAWNFGAGNFKLFKLQQCSLSPLKLKNWVLKISIRGKNFLTIRKKSS